MTYNRDDISLITVFHVPDQYTLGFFYFHFSSCRIIQNIFIVGYFLDKRRSAEELSELDKKNTIQSKMV